jgi:hypothetical protein
VSAMFTGSPGAESTLDFTLSKAPGSILFNGSIVGGSNKRSYDEALAAVQQVQTAYDQVVRLQQQQRYEEFFRMAPKEYMAEYTSGIEAGVRGIIELDEDGTVIIR